MSRRILYATAAYDEAEIEAVMAVLRGGPNALRIGKNVREMEERVAALFGKRSGVLVSSGSGALFLAIDLLNLQPGDEVITSPLTFSTDLSPLIRANAVPVFVDIEPCPRSKPRSPRGRRRYSCRISRATPPTGTGYARLQTLTTSPSLKTPVMRWVPRCAARRRAPVRTSR